MPFLQLEALKVGVRDGAEPRVCCALVYSFSSSGVCSDEVFRTSTPHAFVGANSAFRSGVIGSSALPAGLRRACRMALGRSGSGFLLIHTLPGSSPFDPFPLLIDRIQGP